MSKKLKIFWRNKQNGFGVGHSYGYRIHSQNMLKELERIAGVKIVFNEKDSYDFAVNISAPYQFKPIPGKKNVLFTMCERIDIPIKEKPPELATAEIILTPSEFSKTEFKKHFPDTIIETVPEGFSKKDFPYHERKHPGEDKVFTFLWNGASNQRKGCLETWQAWDKWHSTGRMPENILLIFKTTGSDEKGNPLPGTGISLAEDTHVILDSRNLSTAELCKVYHAAHAFIFPTCGEGWGLTLTEAAATGLPCIYTDFSAPHDWFHPKGGFPLTNYTLTPSRELFSYDYNLNMSVWGPDSVKKKKPVIKSEDKASFQGKEKAFAAQTDVNEIAENMEYIYHNYDEALRRGKIASDHLHNNYSWKQAAEKMVDVLLKYNT